MQHIDISNYFATLNYFTEASKQDRRLNPTSQLLFRLLAENANRNRWTATFTYKLDEFEAVTGLPRETIRRNLQKLKNLGWIDFSGKPSKYTVYNPLGQEVPHSSTPTPPISIHQNNTKEKKKQKRKEETRNDKPSDPTRGSSTTAGDNSEEPTELKELQAAVQKRLKELYG